MAGGFDPIELSRRLETLVARDDSRKYYRFRGARFYGGIATGDVVGCNLRCVFCWTGRPRDDPTVGFWVSSSEAYEKLSSIALRSGFRKVRLSGGEPTIGRRHLLSLLERFDEDGRFIFILETNGILIGYDRSYARELSRISIVHVRVSIKACNPEWFYRLTGAKPEAFDYVINAIKNLADYGVSYHVALMVSFGDENCWSKLIRRLYEIDESIGEKLEPEVIKLYPHVARRLKAAGLWPERYV